MDLKQTWNLARQLMDQHQLQEWRFLFDSARKRAGCCSYCRKTITLSRYYAAMNSDADVRDTILHEIAHAIAGYTAGHGPAWKAICVQIGAKPVRCYGKHIQMPLGKYNAVCPGCTKVFTRHREPKLLPGRYSYCLACGPVEGRLAFYYGPPKLPKQPEPKPKPTLSALFE